MEGMALVVEAHGIVEVAQGRLGAFGALGAPVHEEADAQTAKEAEEAHGVAVAHAALVFLGGDVEALVEPVFDAPARAVELEPAGGGEPCGLGAGEQVDGFRLAGAGVALEHGSLRRGGKAGLLRGDWLGLEGARFRAAFIAFAGLRPSRRRRGGERALGGRRRLRRGEKRPARAAGWRVVLAGRAGCL